MERVEENAGCDQTRAAEMNRKRFKRLLNIRNMERHVAYLWVIIPDDYYIGIPDIKQHDTHISNDRI